MVLPSGPQMGGSEEGPDYVTLGLAAVGRPPLGPVASLGFPSSLGGLWKLWALDGSSWSQLQQLGAKDE